MSYCSFFDHRWLSFDITTDDVKANCDDLKVLGKGDFKALIKWRLALREEVRLFFYQKNFVEMTPIVQLGLDIKAKETEDSTEHVEVVEVVDEEQEISAEVKY